MIHSRKEKTEALGRVIDTLDELRVKCPWDRIQTNASLRPNTIEEVCELSEALLCEDTDNIRKELGDVLLHILFYSRIGEEKEAFDIVDVCDALNAKLIFRHPHVFGEVKASDAHQVELNWEQIKLKEKDGNKTVLSGVPASLPALIKAYRIQEKAANVGFDWEQPGQVWGKVAEEMAEFVDEMKAPGQLHRLEEFGDLLFSIVNAGRLYHLHPDTALWSDPDWRKVAVKGERAGRNATWEDIRGLLSDFETQCMAGHAQELQLQKAYGHLLYALTSYGDANILPWEAALELTNRKFIRRFNYVERCAKAAGKRLKDLPLQQMEAYWQEAKQYE